MGAPGEHTIIGDTVRPRRFADATAEAKGSTDAWKPMIRRTPTTHRSGCSRRATSMPEWLAVRRCAGVGVPSVRSCRVPFRAEVAQRCLTLDYQLDGRI